MQFKSYKFTKLFQRHETNMCNTRTNEGNQLPHDTLNEILQWTAKQSFFLPYWEGTKLCMRDSRVSSVQASLVCRACLPNLPHCFHTRPRPFVTTCSTRVCRLDTPRGFVNNCLLSGEQSSAVSNI